MAGRPKFRQDMELLEELPDDMIVSMLEVGKSQTMICYELGIGRRALEQWIEDTDPTIIARARAKAADKLAVETMTIADGMDVDTGFTETAEEHQSFNFIQLDNGQIAAQPNNRCLWYDQSLIPAQTKFPDFEAAQRLWTVDGSRKWAAGDDWFYDIEEKT